MPKEKASLSQTSDLMKTTKPKQTLISTKELCERTSASVRQIDYWCTAGVISPVGENNPGSGQRRKYDEAIVAKVLFFVKIQNLFKNRVPTDVLNKIYESYDQNWVDLGDGITLSWTKE